MRVPSRSKSNAGGYAGRLVMAVVAVMARSLSSGDHGIGHRPTRRGRSAVGDRGDPFDLIHDHSGYTAVAMADRVSVPVVHTLHGPFTDDVLQFYRRHTGKAHLVALSEAQRRPAPDLPIAATVPNPVDVSDWPFRARKEDYVLWVGRMTAEKGPHRAISAARAAGVRLILAGPVQPGQEEFFRREVAPLVDPYSVRYVGEIGGERKKALFARARALLMPI